MAEGRVLVVDDEAFIRDLVCDFFDSESISCDGASTLGVALENMTARRYKLVLLDRNLESSRDENALEEIRRIQPGVAIVILTGDHQFTEDTMKRIAADGLIHKPFKIDEFMQSVRRFLET